jgi:four helix bundle protein
MTEHKKLLVWQRSVILARNIYQVTSSFPNTQKYSLVDQMCRSAVSVPSNIAEGSKRSTNKDFKSFLHISLGSLAELETQLVIAHDLSYISEKDFPLLTKEVDEISKMLHSLIKKLL